MDRYGWMVVRMYLPAVISLGVALAAMIVTFVFSSSAALNGLTPYLTWLTPIALGVALLSGGYATVRMWNWQSGKAPKCAGCGGALGRVHHAAEGDYRKCLACGGKQAV